MKNNNIIKFLLAAYFMLCSSFSFANINLISGYMDIEGPGAGMCYPSFSDICDLISSVGQCSYAGCDPSTSLMIFRLTSCTSSGATGERIYTDSGYAFTGYNFSFAPCSTCPSNSFLSADQKSCTCSTGYEESGNSCVPPHRTISLSGGGATALPCGDPVELIATVTDSGGSVAGVGVAITIEGGGSMSGSTGADGTFHFLYVPPYLQATSVALTGTCTGCDNQASSSMAVAACEIPQDPDPVPEPDPAPDSPDAPSCKP